MRKEKTEQKTLFAVHMFRVVLELFTTTFLTSHIISVDPNDIFGAGLINIGLFFIAEFITYIIIYLCISFWVGKSNRISFLRAGIVVYAIFLVVMVFYGKSIAEWVMIAGFLSGLSDAFYYSSYHVMRNELNSRSNIKAYNILSTIVSSVIKVVVPTILGIVIDASSYSNIAIYICILVVIQFVVSMFVKSNRPKDSVFEPLEYLKCLKANKEARRKINYAYYNALLAGVKNCYKIIVVILTIYTFKTNLSLGLLSSAFSLGAMLLLMLYKKFDKSPKMNKAVVYTLLGIVPFIACLVLVFYLNPVTLIIYNLCLTVAIQFSDYLGTCERDAIIKHLDMYRFIAEHQFFFELCQCVSRVITYILFVVAGIIGDIIAFKVLLVLFLAANIAKHYVMYKQRTFRKEYEEVYFKEKELEEKEKEESLEKNEDIKDTKDKTEEIKEQKEVKITKPKAKKVATKNSTTKSTKK